MFCDKSEDILKRCWEFIYHDMIRFIRHLIYKLALLFDSPSGMELNLCLVVAVNVHIASRYRLM
jgi:hypothetical protein